MTPQTYTQTQDLEFIVKERAIIYCRVSTDEQAESGTSIDMQAEKNTTYAQANNMQVVGVFKEDYTGRVLDRPELNKVREMLRRGAADNLIVYKPNRLDRSEWGLNTLLLMQELKSLGVSLHYAQDSRRLDLSNPMEVFMYGSFGGWQAGEDFSETVRKLYEGRIARAKAGFVMPAKNPPFGYKKIKENKKSQLVIFEDNARIVRLIFEWYVLGDETGKTLNLAGIAVKLNNMGIKTQNNVAWNPSSVKFIILSESYCGVWHFSKKGSRIPVSIPAIVSRELWEAAQERLKENVRYAERNRKPGRYLLANRLTCDCGRAIIGKQVMGKYTYYLCSTRLIAGRERHKCRNLNFNAPIIDAKVWEWLEEIANDQNRLQAALEDYNTGQQSKLEPIRRELALVEATLKDKNQEWEDDTNNLRFLTSDRAKAKKGAEIAALEAVIKELEAKRDKYLEQLEVSTYTPEQAKGITVFMAEVRQKIARLKELEAQGVDLSELKMAVYEGKRAMLAWLDVQVKLFVLDGKRKAEVKAVVCPNGEVLPIEDSPSKQTTFDKAKSI